MFENTKPEILNTNVCCMLQMLDPNHSIILDENIALLGETEDEVGHTDKVATMLDLRHDKVKRGDYFQVIDRDGCILFNPYVKAAGTMVIGANTVGYCFFLKDYDEEDDFLSIVDSNARTEAVVIYADNKLYAKRNYGDEFLSNLVIDKNIRIESIGNETYLLTFKGNTFLSSVLNKKQKIMQFRLHSEGV